MPSAAVGRKFKRRIPGGDAHSLKRKREDEDVEALKKCVLELVRKACRKSISNTKSSQELNAEFKDFADLPLSQATSKGLVASHFRTLTDIQSKAVPLALKGRDILGAAKTGSGKTLSFLIPMLENLYRQKWTEFDGLGALIISPTRELAIQIFEVLRKIGRYHTFSAGLVIGGRSLQEERERLGRMSILVCTPGRMLQHMDQTAAFEVANLQMLILDEADRIMDMGFQSSVDAIIEHLPKQRQTMLFSATQTKKVSDLARLSLRDAEYVAVHEAAPSATPSTLQQHYVVTPLAEKLNTLYGFIKASLKSKIIVFFSSGKQVRFAYESFRHLQPGIPLLHIHGRQKQAARLDITSKFAATKNACIFATDVVARGLDFPAVDWVIQVDCPEDADTYIHRVGRTARYEKVGRAVLFLDPSEKEGMLTRLEHKKVPIERINIREKKQQKIQNHLQNMCFQDPELKYLGQKAFVSYTRSLFVQKDKEIFNISKYDLEGYASNMGLPGAPRITFQKGDDAKKIKNAPRASLSSGEDSDEEEKRPKKKEEVRTKYDRMFERRNQDVLSGHYSKMIAEDDGDWSEAQDDTDEDDDFLSVKRIVPFDEDGDSQQDENKDAASGPTAKLIPGVNGGPLVLDSKRKEKLRKSKKKLLKLMEKGQKVKFDDDGVPYKPNFVETEENFNKHGSAEAQRAEFLEEEAVRVREADIEDKQLAKEKKREKREKKNRRKTAEDDSVEDDGIDLEEAGKDEDPMALLRSLPLDEDEDEGARPAKRPKKWFEDDSDEEMNVTRKTGRAVEAADEPETLEDLEALAAGLLS